MAGAAAMGSQRGGRRRRSAGDVNSRGEMGVGVGWKLEGWAEGCRCASQHQAPRQTQAPHGGWRRGASQTGPAPWIDYWGGCMCMLGFGSGCAAEDDGGRAFIYLERSDSPCSLAEIAGRPYLGASCAHIDETVSGILQARGRPGGLGRRGWLLKRGHAAPPEPAPEAAPASSTRG